MPTAPAPSAAMMTGPLDDPAQALIDSRLDTIDRLLLGQVSRADRQAIVREVEAQIYDHLAGRDPGHSDRDAAIAALAQLDPPEAFLPDEPRATPRPPVPPAPRRPVDSGRHAARPAGAIAGRVGGVLGVVSVVLLGLAIAAILVGISSNIPALEFVFLGLLLVDVPISLLAINFAAYARFVGASAVVGFVAGTISLLSVVAYCGYALL